MRLGHARRAACVLTVLLAGCGGDGAPDRDASAASDGGAAADGDASSDGSAAGDGAGAGGWFTGTYADASGQRDYRVYVPSGYRADSPAPLVTVLHGCTVDAAMMDDTTRYAALAEQRGFLVVYPEQTAAANPALCWNWFDPANQTRGQGEGTLIAGATRAVMMRWSIDQRRVFVIGASAGGAMSVLVGATYPDLFAAVGVVAGCEFGGAPCGATGGPAPKTQGHLAYQAMGAFARAQPVIVFQGDADPVVAPVNGQQVIDQWIATDDEADDGVLNGSVPSTPAQSTSGQVPNGRAFELAQYDGASGSTLLEYFLVHGAGHAWPGGPASASFTDPGGPDATTLSYEFFLAHAR
jgi:poly(hydroxyalkanoate) depolymerase family esterase